MAIDQIGIDPITTTNGKIVTMVYNKTTLIAHPTQILSATVATNVDMFQRIVPITIDLQ